MRVLIVDDDSATRAGLAELLRDAGYDPTAVASVDDALRVLLTTPPDFLITDYGLADSNGLRLVASSPKGLPTIVLTGCCDEAVASKTKREGAAYMIKPVSPSRLLDQIKSMLAGTRATHDAVPGCPDGR
jgi:DNA-binding response OmpR family regulator